MTLGNSSSTQRQTANTHQQYTVVREVLVDQALVGQIIGKQGMHLKHIQDRFDVNIAIEKASTSGDKRKITISGKTERDVEDAIEEVVLERAVLPIDSTLIEYVCGYKDQNVRFFEEKSGVVQIDVDQDKFNGNFSIVAIGTRHSLEDLRTMVQTHINLHDKYQERNVQQQHRKVFNTAPTATQAPAQAPHQANGQHQQKVAPANNGANAGANQYYRKK